MQHFCIGNQWWMGDNSREFYILKNGDRKKKIEDKNMNLDTCTKCFSEEENILKQFIDWALGKKKSNAYHLICTHVFV